MLHFSRLIKLHSQFSLLQQIIPEQEMFVVGGALRDLLLGIGEEITDIDLTGTGTPESRWNNMHLPKIGRARFRTEKFGTMTLVQKTSTPEVTYEITPFREESGYADNRHPEQIIWSQDLLADSKRRDFTINALYRTPWTSEHLPPNKQHIILKDEQHLLNLLNEQGGCVLIETGTVILQAHELIADFLENNTLPKQIPYITTDELQQPIQLQQKSNQTTHKELKIQAILLDPQGGLHDLVRRKIRAVGNPEARFVEDALRILRGLRFVNMLNQQLPFADKQNSGFDFEKKTRQAMEKTASLVSELSAERCHAELIKVFSGNNPFGYIALLREVQLLEILFPALAHTIGNRQPVRYHPFDTYNHTLLTLRHLQHLSSDPLVKFAMLYHDVGKPEQYAFMDKAISLNPDNPDRTGYIAHPEISVRLALEDFAKLAFSEKEKKQICWYIKRHHRPGEILDSKIETRTKKLRELLSEGGFEATRHLLIIAIADRLGQFNPLQKPAISQLELLKTMLTELYEKEGQFTMKQLAVNGNDLMQELGVTPGPQLGELLEKAFTRVMEDLPTRNTKEEIIKFLQGVK